jgi:putative transposase
MKKKKILLQLEKHHYLVDLPSKLFGKWLTYHKSMAIKHLQDKEELINKVFKNCVILIYLMKTSHLAKNKIFSILEFPLKNKWMIFLDKLNTSENQNILTIYLFQMLVQELISKEKVCKPFWNHAYNTLSEKLLLPIETDYVDLPLNSLNPLLQKQVVNSQFLKITTTQVQKMNYHKTCYPLSTSLIVDKWEKGLTKEIKNYQKKPLKTLKIRLYPTLNQKKIINNFIDTYRFVYNRTLEYIKKNGHEINFQSLRNLLATERTRQNHTQTIIYKNYISILKSKPKSDVIEYEIKELEDEINKLPLIKNQLIYDFELNTSNEIRSNAIKHVCNAYETGFSNLQAGNIKCININFKKKSCKQQTIELASTDIKMTKDGINISPSKFPKNEKTIKIHKKMLKKYKDIVIKNNCDLKMINNKYYIYITLSLKIKENKNVLKKFCGVDPGIRSFVTIYGNNELTEIELKNNILEKYNKKMRILKNYRTRPRLKYERNKYRKKHISKIEKKKTSITNILHWSVINYLIKTQDIIFFGDINSHNIVKKNNIKVVNRQFNDLKFYIFKKRLLYKCLIHNKKVFFINESYTSKTCSSCGTIWNNLGSSKIYKCQNTTCNKIFDRDFNASKNICMKGILN